MRQRFSKKALSLSAAFLLALAACGSGEESVLYSSQGGVAVEFGRGLSDEVLGSVVDGEDSENALDAESDSVNISQRVRADEIILPNTTVPPTTTVPSPDTAPENGIGALTALASVPSEREVSFHLFVYDLVIVTWDDGNIQHSDVFGEVGHYTYPTITRSLSPGEYTITIEGPVLEFSLGRGLSEAFPIESREVFTGVSQWPNSLYGVQGAFEGLNNLVSVPRVLPPDVTDLSKLFYEAASFNGDIGGWDVSNVTDMSSMFEQADAFNQDIGGWDVSNVTDMSAMFSFTDAFNQDIGGWDVSNVGNMMNMFAEANAFNQDIGGWDVSNVTEVYTYTLQDGMFAMFYDADAFNQDLSSWCVSSTTSEPEFFSDFTSSWNLPRPVWGSCPS